MLSRQTTEVRTLPVTLSPEQLAVKAQELAVAVVEADEQKRALALAAEGWKERKKALEAELHRREGVASGLAVTVETGVEELPVSCSWLYALEVGWAFLVRSDTGELVTKRQLEGAERQENLVEVLQEPTPQQLAEWLAPPEEQDEDGPLTAEEAAGVREWAEKVLTEAHGEEEAPDPMGEELEAIAADGFQAGPGEEAAEPPTAQIIDLMQALSDSLEASGGAKVDA